MEKVVIQVQTDTTQAVKGIEQVDESIKDVNKSSADTTNSLDKMSGGAISTFKNFKSGLASAVKGFKSLKFAIAATGIGALIIAITAVGQAFTRSEEGQNKFAKLMGVIGAVTGQFMDAIAGLGDLIIGAFENPKQALTDFANLIKDNIVNRFEGLLELVPQLGKAIGLLFEGKFGEAGKTAANAVAKVSLGVEDIVGKTQQAIDKTNEFIQATVKEGEIAGKIADQRAKADKVDRELLVERAEANRRIAELREQAADKENVSLEKRLEAIKEAGQIEADITQKEIEAAKLRLEAKQAENALGLSTKADLEEEAQLKAQVINLETNRLRTQKALTAELTTAIREQAAEEKSIKDQAAAEEKARKDKLAKEDAERLKEKQRLEKEAADKKAADDKAEAQRVAAFEQFKQQSIQQGIAGATALVGKNSKFGKAIAVANAIRDTYAGANKALAQGGIFGFIGAAGIIASGLANVKTITSTKDPKAPSGVNIGGSTPSIPTPSAASQPPAFNIVGAGAGNQLAETIAGQNQRPVKAFVVSQDVTTAQSLERNIVDGASI